MADHSIPRITGPTSAILEGLQANTDFGASRTMMPVLCEKVALTAEASPANGGMFSWQNPLDVKVLAYAYIDVTTPATGAATADVGRTAAAAATADTLFDGIDIGTAADLHNPIEDQGINGEGALIIDEKDGTNDWIAGTASADSSGLVGNAYIIFIPVS